MLDQIIHKHIDALEDIEERMFVNIDSLIDNINIDELIDSPTDTILGISSVVKDLIEDIYSAEAMKLGFELADQINESIKENDLIEVTDSDDPNINKDLLDDKFRD